MYAGGGMYPDGGKGAGGATGPDADPWAGGVADAGVAVIAEPQFVQNWYPGWFANPHFGQTFDAAKCSASGRADGVPRGNSFRGEQRLTSPARCGLSRGHAGWNRPLDLLRARPAQCGPRDGEEDPCAAPRGSPADVPHAGG